MNNNKIRIVVGAIAVSAACIVGIANREKFMSNAYQDSGGVWTVGYGETKGVKKGDKITPERALIKLNDSVDQYAKQIKNCFGDVKLYQHEFDAYVDLSYNVGAGAVCKSSIPKKLREERYEDACKTILSFDKIRKNGVLVSCHDPKNNCLGIVKDRKRVYNMCMGNNN